METVFRSHARLKSMVFVALMAAFLCIFSPISIPLPLVPITLQTFGVFLVSALLGWKRGTVAVLIYLLLGLIGLPVFSGWTGGFSSFATPSSGYIIGFLFTALLTGFLIDRFSRQFWMYPVA
ncbi:MAG TPA: biotin transporter BioY, partial [Candidatus Egerieicola pullicola]|nr:biotin transporter BioY [Candidatus Egerieicola pullicola]